MSLIVDSNFADIAELTVCIVSNTKASMEGCLKDFL